MTQIIDGNAVAAAIKASVADSLGERELSGRRVGLAVVLVGDDPASAAYVRMKARDCREVGIEPHDYLLPADTSQADLNALIDRLNADDTVQGILVQLPLPAGLDTEQVVARIAPAKDVDGFHPENLGRLLRGLDAPRPCTPAGVMCLLDRAGVQLSGAHAVVVGRSLIVGKPMALLLLERNATVTVCHSRTRDLAEVCRQADVLVAAVGRPKMIGAEHVKPGAVVIDVGINRVTGDDGKSVLVGDVDYDAVAPLATAITPVPGGVGPMTRALLMANTRDAALRQWGLR
ncbi:MAG: bifunctional methylenetetrahydrofolate dehydrogenase/methenyltetrahydrofolate cyclohydrolase FolD [Actinomycetes bacterium]|jgi:methylenetetrahydrofolate dehydrogenase (NADP+)/methenyltetrahydrofolate cyclohydrolase|nr:bifunctional methylenetetrahydrofolate dehydrogenase/methenyltetrahydrofolate cyclohydrolase FolD [Actinomycetes bacterium]